MSRYILQVFFQFPCPTLWVLMLVVLISPASYEHVRKDREPWVLKRHQEKERSGSWWRSGSMRLIGLRTAQKPEEIPLCFGERERT